MYRSKGAPANLLLDNVLIDTMLCGAIIVTGDIFGSGIEGFLLASAGPRLEDWKQFALSLDGEQNGRVAGVVQGFRRRVSTCKQRYQTMGSLANASENHTPHVLLPEVCAPLDAIPFGRKCHVKGQDQLAVPFHLLSLDLGAVRKL